MIFSGAASAVVTPFKNGKIDFASFEKQIERQITEGIAALVILGTTGEASTVTYEERDEIIRFVVRAVSSRVPVIVGCGSNCTDIAAKMAREASELGADGILAVTPYYNKGSKVGLVRHFEAIASGADVPVIIYNVPSRTGVDLSLDVIEKLAENEMIVGIKEASGSASKSAGIIARFGDDMPVYSGSDEVNLPILAIGGKGVISVLSNVMPRETVKLCRDISAGRYEEASENFISSFLLTGALFCDVNPIPVKYALSLLDLCTEEVRLPLAPLDDDKKLLVRREMERCGLI